MHKKISVGAEIISAEQKILKNGFILFFIKSHIQIYKNFKTYSLLNCNSSPQRL